MENCCSLFELRNIGKSKLVLKDPAFVKTLGSVFVCRPKSCVEERQEVDYPSMFRGSSLAA